MRLVFVCGVVIALAMGACGGGGDKSPTPAAFEIPASSVTVTGTTPTREAVAAGCSMELPEGYTAGEVTVRSWTDGPWQRDIRMYVPSGYEPGEPVALVLNFHGLGGDAIEQEKLSGLIDVAERENFMLVTPDGSGRTRGWNTLDIVEGPVDDVAFVRALVNGIEQGFCIDPGRIYATGFSNGGFLTALLACQASDRFAAIAPVAGLHFPQSFECGGAVPILAVHGTDDEVVPFEAGQITNGPRHDGIRAEMAAWAEHNGCTGPPASEAVAGAVTREAYECPSGVDVELVLVDGGGHAWPGADGVGGGISAAEEIWAFFEAHAR